jgi:hypothetical protein
MCSFEQVWSKNDEYLKSKEILKTELLNPAHIPQLS